MAQKKRPLDVFVISDATGITAERVVQAVLVQFQRNVAPRFHRFPHVRKPAQLKKILELAGASQGLVIYSLVSPELQDFMRLEERNSGLDIINLLGPLLRRMRKRFKAIPSLHPGLLSMAGEESIRLASTIDFTLRHDDGGGVEDLGLADVILMGVSRTSKTPTSLLLACNHDLKVANVPIIMGMEPPEKLFHLKRAHLVGLTISPVELLHIRSSRYGGRDIPGYTDIKAIRQELTFCHEIYARLERVQEVDVTNRPIEEVARIIMQHLRGG